jgi:uncharacterized membrane protein YheB (UPF0754 family)
MEKSILVEINRMKEIMGLRLLTESKIPFIDDFIEKLAKNADEGDLAARNLFSNIFQDEAATVIDDLVQNKKTVDTIFADKDLMDDFIERALKSAEKIDGMTVKSIFYQTLENSLDPIQSQLGKDLQSIQKTIDDLTKYETEPDLYNQAIEALETMKRQINDVFSNDTEMQKIINSSAGLDDIPERKIIDDVTDNVVDDAAEETAEETGESKLPFEKSWNDVKPLTPDELKSLRKSNKLWDTISNGFFKKVSDMISKEITLSDELLSSIKSLQEMLNKQGADTTMSAPLQKRIGDLLLQITQKRKDNFAAIESWVGKNVPSGNVKSKIQNLEGYNLAKSITAGEFVDGWNKKYADLLGKQRFMLTQLNSVFNPFAWVGKKVAKKYGGDNWGEAVMNKWSEILWGESFRKFRWGFPLGLPKPGRAYLEYLSTKGIPATAAKLIFDSVIMNYIKYISLYVVIDLTTDFIANWALIFILPNNEWVKSQKKHFEEMLGVEPNQPDDRTFGETVGTMLINYYVENGKNMDAIFPGFADDAKSLIQRALKSNSDETVKQVRDDAKELLGRGEDTAKEGIEKAKEELKNQGIDIDTLHENVPVVPNTTPTDTNQPDNQEPTPPDDSIQKGTASNEDKISLRDYLNNPEQFKKYTSIDKGEVEGTIITRFVDINGDNVFATIYKDSGGVWRYKKSNNPLPRKEN